jgi:F-type H+-transporting ATPase subunit alpha
MMELLKQPDLRPLPFEVQAVIIFAGTKGLLDDLPLESIATFKEKLVEELDSAPELAKKIRDTEKLENEVEAKLEEIIKKAQKI